MRGDYQQVSDPGFAKYTAETMLPLLRQLEQELAGVKIADDIEYIHRARVATRRLRACFTIFSSALPLKEAREWRKNIREITRALGEARDLDVQIAFIQKYLSDKTDDNVSSPVLFYSGGTNGHPIPNGIENQGSDQLFWRWTGEQDPESEEKERLRVSSLSIDPKRPGLECLLQRLVQRRHQIQPGVVKVVQRLEESHLLESMATCLHEQKIKAALEDSGDFSLYSYEQAFLHIMTAIQDLFWYEPWLSEPEMIHRHHEMRIAAKRLRYTLESFGDLYASGLKSEIKTFKSLQDVLGDMHDCDVWIARIPAIMQAEKEKSSRYFGNYDFYSLLVPGLSALLNNREQKRSQLFSELQTLWDELKRDGFWNNLEETVSEPMQHSFQGMEGECRDTPVQIAFISDIHANLPALEAVLADAKERGVTAVLNAGDSIGYGAFPDEVVTLLRSFHVISVIGNYDRSVLTKKWKSGKPRSKDKQIAMRFAYHHLSLQNREYLAGLPREQRIRVMGRTILVTHGSPDSLTEYLVQETPDSRLSEIAQKTGADFIITGHAHLPSIRQVDDSIFVNCGSVGRTEDGDPRACYALLTLNPFSICHIRVPYDISRAIAAIRLRHLPDSFVRIVSEGKPLDIVSGEEDEF